MIIRIFLGSLIAVLLANVSALATTNQGLRAIHTLTAARYVDVKHVSSDEVAAKLRRAPKGVLVLDVREPKEYAVSRIPGAQRVSPAIDADTFRRHFGKALRGRNVVLYCSVGVRSTELASRIRTAALDAGATSVANLTGGIFSWHNERRSLVNENGPTNRIHPYNSFWGTLIERDDMISYDANARTATSGTNETTNR